MSGSGKGMHSKFCTNGSCEVPVSVRSCKNKLGEEAVDLIHCHTCPVPHASSAGERFLV